MKRRFAGRQPLLLLVLGGVSTVGYLALAMSGPLRQNLAAYFLLYTALFAIYWAAVALVVREAEPNPPSPAVARWLLPAIFGFAVIFRLILIPSEPSLSDDMFRYVWDGRIQAAGINPYAHPPGAVELAPWRDPELWPRINRKPFITVYPAGTELLFAGIYRFYPESVPWTKLAICLFDLAAMGLLVLLLRRRGLSPSRALIYGWCPLIVVELASSGHSEGLLLPFLLLGLLLLDRRPWLAGLALGAATAIKLLPALLVAAFVRRPGWWKLALAAGAVFVLAYLPYLNVGQKVLSFLPLYFREEFNSGIHRLVVTSLRGWLGFGYAEVVRQVSAAILLGLVACLALRRPRQKPEATALTICGVYLLLAPNLHPWYVAWLVPLAALLVRPGKAFGLRFEPTTGWLLLSGLVALAYVWFVAEKPEYWALWAQHGIVAVFLAAPLLRAVLAFVRGRLARPARQPTLGRVPLGIDPR